MLVDLVATRSTGIRVMWNTSTIEAPPDPPSSKSKGTSEGRALGHI